MRKLSPRLKMAAELVRPGVTVADIGTDHAYLPSYLVEKEIISRAVACDLRHAPLENARETLERCNQLESIELRLSDGLDALCPDDADDFVLAGMGGTLISRLIARTSWLCDPRKHLILQPMTHSEDVRRTLCELGFVIVTERACFDDGRCYIAMLARFSHGAPCEKSEAYFYFGEHPLEGSEASLEYVRKQNERIKTRLEALTAADIKHGEVQALREALKRGET